MPSIDKFSPFFLKKRPGLKYRDAIKILPNMVNILSITNCEEHWIGHAAHMQKSSIASKTQQLQAPDQIKSKLSHGERRPEEVIIYRRRSCQRARRPPGTRASARPSARPCNCQSLTAKATSHAHTTLVTRTMPVARRDRERR